MTLNTTNEPRLSVKKERTARAFSVVKLINIHGSTMEAATCRATAYHDAFSGLASDGLIDLPTIPDACKHNAHMFYVKLKDLNQRTDFISFLRSKGVQASFHYVPLHSSPAGERFGRFSGIDEFTTRESDRLVRLPMYYGMSKEDRERVIDAVLDYFSR